MIFGSTKHPEQADLQLPDDHPGTCRIIKATSSKGLQEICVGCAKWGKRDLKNFYPRGTKDPLRYYATQFNSIEMNSTFYRIPHREQVKTWKAKTPDYFKFFPKVTKNISHRRWLKNTDRLVKEFCDSVSHFEEQLGMPFLQMHPNFSPRHFNRLAKFIKNFSKTLPLAVELRHKDWFQNREVSEKYYQLLEHQRVTNVITDTAGKRALIHMRLTSDAAFIRYVGANHPTDYQRLDDWVEHIKLWQEQGLKKLYFFVHQNIERSSPQLSAYFIKNLNKKA